MRFFLSTVICTVLLALSGCSSAVHNGEQAGTTTTTSTSAETASRSQSAAEQKEGKTQTVSLTQAAQAQEVSAATERKIVRDAQMIIELSSPADGQRKLNSIAEAHGGFVVISESQQHDKGDGAEHDEVINIEMRVPAAQFDAVVAEIRAVGSRVRQEKITGKDVTEEYIDLEARLRTQRALEAQFLEIMKHAEKVSDALEVNRQLADVRNEIERVEGRRRFLENQVSLSTIKVTLQTPSPLVSANTSGFFYGIKRAFGDGVDVAAAIILVLIRIVIALIPVFILIVLPLIWLYRFITRRRARRIQLGEVAQPITTTKG